MIKYCCDGMRNAVIEGAVQGHDGRPEITGRGSEASNVHFPLSLCPFCGASLRTVSWAELFGGLDRCRSNFAGLGVVVESSAALAGEILFGSFPTPERDGMSVGEYAAQAAQHFIKLRT